MIIGHKRQIQLLDLHIRTGTVSHAYLFTGPRHVGKMTVARRAACFLLCKRRAREALQPCGACEPCRLLETRSHQDVMVEDIHANAQERDKIRVEDIRRMRDRASRSGYGGRSVFIVRDAGLMTREAANAFLKILEEPRGETTFFLIAETADDVLATVRSRAWHVRFWPVLEKSPIFSAAQRAAAHSLRKDIAADRLAYANTVREHPDRMQEWYRHSIAALSLELHDMMVTSSGNARLLVAAAGVKRLIQGEERFQKSYATKRLQFENDILSL